MRAFVVTGPGVGSVEQVEPPAAAPGEAVVDVERVGVCGTDVELFDGSMEYLHNGVASYPIRLGHEWSGIVTAVGDGIDPRRIGTRVMGDTMIGDGTCRRCRRGHQHVCERISEVGMHGYDGALAEQIAVPVSSLHEIPTHLDATVGALVEPGGNALRATDATEAAEGDRVLVIGPGTIGLLTSMFLRARGAEVHLLGIDPDSLDFASSLGFPHTWLVDDVPAVAFDAVVDASNSADSPGRALELVEPAGRIVCIGLAGSPSRIDTRVAALKDVTMVGILSASPALEATIETFAAGHVDPRPLVAATVGLSAVGDLLGGSRPASAGPGPKFHVDVRRD